MKSAKTSALVFYLVSSVMLAAAHPTKIIAALADPDTTSETAKRIISDQRLQRELAASLAKELPMMLLEARSVPVIQNEARVAGALKNESTIPSLIQLLSSINFDLNTTTTRGWELRDDPVARALYDIGAPAERPVADALYSKNQEKRNRAAGILILRNTPRSRSLLEAYSRTDIDERMKAYLNGYGNGKSQ